MKEDLTDVLRMLKAAQDYIARARNILDRKYYVSSALNAVGAAIEDVELLIDFKVEALKNEPHK